MYDLTCTLLISLNQSYVKVKHKSNSQAVGCLHVITLSSTTPVFLSVNQTHFLNKSCDMLVLVPCDRIKFRVWQNRIPCVTESNSLLSANLVQCTCITKSRVGLLTLYTMCDHCRVYLFFQFFFLTYQVLLHVYIKSMFINFHIKNISRYIYI